MERMTSKPHPQEVLNRPGGMDIAYSRTDLAHEGALLHRWWRERAPGFRLEPEAHLGISLVGSNPTEWTRGCDARRIDLMSCIPETVPPYLLVEGKRSLTPGNLDAAVGALYLERALAEAEHGLDTTDVLPVAVFDSAAVDPTDSVPATLEVMLRAVDELGIRVELATADRIQSLNEVVL